MSQVPIHKTARFSLKRRWQSIGHAWQGIRYVVRHEHNARIHLVISLLLLVLAIGCRVNRTEALALILSMGFLWSAEIFNTSIERIMDYQTDKKNNAIRIIKDVAAAAVLVAGLTAMLTIAFVFGPAIATILGI